MTFVFSGVMPMSKHIKPFASTYTPTHTDTHFSICQRPLQLSLSVAGCILHSVTSLTVRLPGLVNESCLIRRLDCETARVFVCVRRVWEKKSRCGLCLKLYGNAGSLRNIWWASATFPCCWVMPQCVCLGIYVRAETACPVSTRTKASFVLNHFNEC